MPLLSFRARLAKAQRNYGGSHFTNLKTNAVSTDENLIDLSEYIETLIGDDDWCGQDIGDRNVVDLTDDDILNELDNIEVLVSNPTPYNSPSIRYTALLVHPSATSNNNREFFVTLSLYSTIM